MIRRLLAVLAASWRRVVDPRESARAESVALTSAYLLAAVRAGVARCIEHPDEPGVTVVLHDGVPVVVCEVCLVLPAPQPVRRGRHVAPEGVAA